ncbi:MAG: carbohydrate-binding domain-containing protein [Ruminococcus sp.]|nr:carbohydrate-binding domain-containing protein [Ruminococcus sp.]
MKRRTKNFVMLFLLILLALSVCLTFNYSKNNINTNNNFIKNIKEDTPLNIPSEEGIFNDSKEPQNFDKPDNTKMPNDRNNMGDFKHNSYYLSWQSYLLFGLESLLISLIILYLIMSKFNQRTFKETFINADKIIIYILGNIIVTSILLISEVIVTNNHLSFNNKPFDQNSEKDKVDLNENNIISTNNIDLNNYKTDVTITKGGTYTFSGNFKNSIIVNAENEDVEIVLNNVKIETQNTGAIIGLSANSITITSADETENTLSDGGNSEYDGCVWSNAKLIFEGSGKLIVNGNQNEGEGIATEAKDITFNSGTYIITSNDDGINAGGDGATITINGGIIYVDASGDGIDSNKDAIINGGKLFVMGSDIGGDAGIDTDAGYTINGGEVIALGSDMIETPKNTSTQKSLCFTLNNKINKDTLVTLMKDDEVIVSFKASKSFKTIIISSDNLEDANYSLYQNGTNTGTLEYGIYQNGKYTKGDLITINNLNVFNASKMINIFGSNR